MASEEWLIKGVGLSKLRRYESAIRAFDKALKINPEDAKAWNNKGIAFYKLGRYKDALMVFDKTLEINPAYAEVWNNKGIEKLETHQMG